ncbi:MAG: hypothetical protein ABIW46_04200 [Acidimicrobiales bacterium]
MKRVALVLALAAAGIMGVDALADATQNRPDVVQTGSSSRLTLVVENRRGPAGLVEAQALWAVCNRTARSLKLMSPVADLGHGTYRVAVTPSVGDHAERRLVGCLEDMTLDGLLGRVTALDHMPALSRK